MFAQAGLAFGAPPPPPKRVVLQDPATPRDPGNLERHALGDRAESELGDLLTQLGTQFDPRKGTGPNESDRYKAGNLFAGASMDGERIDQQRLLKLMRHTGYRAAGFLGTGAGKTATSIGSFADAHSQGVASHGLFLVPLAVQDQFDGAMQEFTAPGRYRWQAGGKDHNDRVSALRNQDTHVRVQTHQSFAQDQMKLMADHHGISTEAMAARFRRQSPAERAQTLRAVHDAVGIPMHHVYVDEGHMLTTRKGEEESLQAMVIKAASHPTNATGYLNGTATPGKNDLHELLGLAADVQPDQYSDRHRLLNNYANEGTMAAPDALRRELDHMTYTARVDPPTDRISVSNPMIGEDGKVTSRKHLELSAEHAAHVAEADAAFKAARLAHRAGGVDVEACKRLNPRRFEGVPEEQHEDLAREMGPALGLIRAHAQRRAINQAPPEINTKVQAMLSVLQHDTQAGKQSIIFTDSREEAEMLHRYLSQQGLATGLYHGGHTQEARANFRRDFKGGHLRIAIMTSAGEAGIHLPEATAVHHYDIAKTAKSHTQRTGRAHRQGQTKDVHVYDWTTDTEHDARALATLQKKHRLASVAETPLGPMDEHGFAADYHEHITAKHASTDIVSLAAK